MVVQPDNCANHLCFYLLFPCLDILINNLLLLFFELSPFVDGLKLLFSNIIFRGLWFSLEPGSQSPSTIRWENFVGLNMVYFVGFLLKLMLFEVELLQSGLLDPIVIGNEFDQWPSFFISDRFGNINTCSHRPLGVFGWRGLLEIKLVL